MLVIDSVEMGLVIDALSELFRVESELSCDLDGAVSRVRVSTWLLEVEVMELPPGVLVAGAFSRHCGDLRRATVIDDVAILKPGEAGGDQFFLDARPNLGREAAAAASQEVGVLLDHHRRVGAAERGAPTHDLHSRLLIR